MRAGVAEGGQDGGLGDVAEPDHGKTNRAEFPIWVCLIWMIGFIDFE